MISKYFLQNNTNKQYRKLPQNITVNLLGSFEENQNNNRKAKNTKKANKILYLYTCLQLYDVCPPVFLPPFFEVGLCSSTAHA